MIVYNIKNSEEVDMDENNNSSLREIEKMMDLEEGTLKNNFIALDSLSCCKVLSNIMEEMTTAIAVSPAAFNSPTLITGWPLSFSFIRL